MTQEEINKKALERYPKIIGSYGRDKNKGKRNAYVKALTEMKYVDMESPFTGGRVTLETKDQEIEYRGEKVKITRKYYRCEDTGNEFTDTKLDSDMMWDVFRAYWDKKNPEHFSDIDLYDAPKIKGWVARDKDGCLNFWGTKPLRWPLDEDECFWTVIEGCFFMALAHVNMFPDLKWEDDPIEVELIIRKV